MKTLGIVGGIGPESTIDYYRSLVQAWREATRDDSYPPIIINSIDITRMLGLIAEGKLEEVTEYLHAELQKLARAGADFGLLAANAPHIVFDELQRRSSIPLLSIVEATRDAACASELTRLGLIGARFTMQGRFYPEVFAQAKIALVTPKEDEQTYIHDRYMSELIKGVFLPETRQALLAIAERLKTQEGIQGLILAGTELPLILREGSCGIPFLDTTQIHVRAALKRMLA